MFTKLFHKKAWDNAYIAEAKFYQKAGKPVGVFALTEDTDTILPLKPYALIDGVELMNWEIF